MSVEPRHHTPRNLDRPTRGPEVAVVAERKGRPLMPWQRDAVDVALELDPETGLYWYDTVIVTVQRQAGKTDTFGVVADHRCMTTHRGRAWLTMQQGKDASAWMRNEWHDSVPPGWTAAGHVEKSLRAGSEGLYYPATGSRFQVFAPKRDAMHSKQSDLTGIDEAWAHDAEKGQELEQAIDPTQATRPGAQKWVLSTAGDDGSEYLEGMVALGVDALADPTSRVCLIDYGIPADADPEDLDVIAAWHPAVGHTIDRAVIAGARKRFRKKVNGLWIDDSAGFARAYGNRPTRARTSAFDAGVWARNYTPRVEIPGRVGIAFDVTPGPTPRTAVLAAWRGLDGKGRPRLFWEVIREDAGTDWAAPFIAALAKKYRTPVGYEAMGVSTLEVADTLARKHRTVQLQGLDSEDYAVICGKVNREILEGTVAHFRQEAMDSAVDVVGRAPFRDGGWRWSRLRSTGSIAPIVAATVATRVYDTLPAESKPQIHTSRRRAA